MNYRIYGYAVCILFLAACGTIPPNTPPTVEPTAVTETVVIQPTIQNTQLPIATLVPTVPARATQEVTLLPPEPAPASASEFRTDFSRHTIPYDQILSGGPPKDGIPAIDQPTFVDVTAADTWLKPQEPVVFLQVGTEARAYPIQILIWHEIVNDTLGGTPVSITFCPLCNTAIAFERQIDDQVLDFGTTGRLRYSNMIMYDRQTESWWQQANGDAIAGQYAGMRLKTLPALIISWADFRATHPTGQVLSRETGASRDYGRNPYPGYDDINASPFLYDGPATPNTLPASARVLSIEQGNQAVAYPYLVLAEQKVINDSIDGQAIVVFWQEGTASALDTSTIADGREVGAVASYSRTVGNQILTFQREGETFLDKETNSRWNILGQAVDGPLAGTQLIPIVSINHFWFSWVAFRPDTRVYQP